MYNSIIVNLQKKLYKIHHTSIFGTEFLGQSFLIEATKQLISLKAKATEETIEKWKARRMKQMKSGVRI